jgi:hypothetical protein
MDKSGEKAENPTCDVQYIHRVESVTSVTLLIARYLTRYTKCYKKSASVTSLIANDLKCYIIVTVAARRQATPDFTLVVFRVMAQFRISYEH